MIQGETVGIWQQQEPSGSHTSAGGPPTALWTLCPCWGGTPAISSSKSSGEGFLSTAAFTLPTNTHDNGADHAPRFLLGRQGPLSWAYISLWTLAHYSPFKSFCPKGIWRGRWGPVVRIQDRISKEVNSDGKEGVCPWVFLRTPKQTLLFFLLRFELGTTACYLATMGREFVWEWNRQLERSEVHWLAGRTGFLETCFTFWISEACQSGLIWANKFPPFFYFFFSFPCFGLNLLVSYNSNKLNWNDIS